MIVRHRGLRLIDCLLIISLAIVGLLPTRSVGAAPRVHVYQDILKLRAYDWRSALMPTQPDDLIFPYPRLDFDRIGGVSEITTNVIVLENANTRLTIAPEFGGRILRWFNKQLGHEMLYVNPVLKPTRWGYRGWWLATGGIEWAFPTNEHGLNEWRPWRYHTFATNSYAGVTVFDHEDRTGLDVAVTIILYANDGVAIVPRISNQTRAPQQFQFWINAMLPYSPDAEFTLPAQQVEVHSTGDDSLPQAGQTLDWPKFNGRDFSRAAEWHQYLGVFAAPTVSGSASVFYPDVGLRLTRYFPFGTARGVKLFLLGDLPSDLYTDGDSRYLELWGGYTRTFDGNATIKSGGTITWLEYWTIR